MELHLSHPMLYGKLYVYANNMHSMQIQFTNFKVYQALMQAYKPKSMWVGKGGMDKELALSTNVLQFTYHLN